MREIDFEGYKFTPPTSKPNRMLIPVNKFNYVDSDVEKFNEIYQWCLELEREGVLTKFVRTPSGGISYKLENLRGGKWEVRVGASYVDMVIRHPMSARYYRFQLCYRPRLVKNEKGEVQKQMNGRQAYWLYIEILKKHGINLEVFAIENGLDVKKTIPSPRNEFFGVPERTYANCYHLDINSAYNAGIAEGFPQLEPAIREMYNMRKEHPEYKQVLNMTQGFLQSSLCDYKYAHISRAGYVYTARRIEELLNALSDKGYTIIAINTDGIWYQSHDGTRYHDDDEGSDLGQWKHDWTECKIRFRSVGAYEIYGKSKDGTIMYKPVVRGTTSYEKMVPREFWEWGDIFKGGVESYIWRPGTGIVRDENYDFID